MNLRQLQYFLEIAELRSFTRAAEVLHIAQSALSRQIRLLEEELGANLFNRLDRGVTLTEAGDLLRDRASVLLRQFSSLRDEVGTKALAPRGELSIGMPPSMREMVTTPLVDGYCRQYPDVALHVHEGISVDLVKLVQDGRLDCAVVVDLSSVPLTKAELILREQLYLVGPRKTRLSIDTVVSLEAVATRPLILTTRPNSLRLVVENALARARLPLKLIADSNSTAMMVDLVGGGLAYSVLPYCAAWKAVRNRRLAAAPVEDLMIDWIFISPSERGPSLAAVQFKQRLFDLVRNRIAAREWLGATIAEPP